MNEPLQISDKAREAAKKEVGSQNSREFWTERLSTAPKQGHFVQQLLDEQSVEIFNELVRKLPTELSGGSPPPQWNATSLCYLVRENLKQAINTETKPLWEMLERMADVVKVYELRHSQGVSVMADYRQLLKLKGQTK